MRAREPDTVGAIVRDGVRVAYEVFEGPAGAAAVLLLPAWAIVHMRQWKLAGVGLAVHHQHRALHGPTDRLGVGRGGPGRGGDVRRGPWQRAVRPPDRRRRRRAGRVADGPRAGAESAHLEAEAGEHDLHAFRAIRRMDEILLANFHVFADVADAEHHDLVVADEGWEIDHFLHENPELKRAPFAWLTDFVGWLPMPDGGREELALTADYNAEMIEHVARYPRLRDRSVFVGDPDDLVTSSLGPGLPTVRDWTTEHFAFSGWIRTGGPARDRDELRAELGWRPDERVCVASVGGSGVGRALLERAAAAYPLLADRVPGLRLVAVAGPRIDSASLRVPPGVEVRGHVPDLERELTACDVAVVQGGLTTTMELAAAGRPFVYVPLAHHFEQQFHVPHRLRRHGAGVRMDYADLTTETLATAVADLLARPAPPVPALRADGAARAADLLAELL